MQSATDDEPQRPPSSRLRSVPPIDPTAPPSVIIRIAEPPRAPARPILASECLREDLAPTEPFPRATRAALALSGVTLLAAMVLVEPSSVLRAVVLLLSGGLALNGAFAREYRTRGRLALLSAVGCFAIPSLVTPAAIVLSGALFLRASYRAHRAVRVALGVGVLLLAIAAITTFPASHLGAVVVGGALALSLLGFMGEQTTGGAAIWGGVVLATAPTVVLLSAPFSFANLGLALGALGASTASSIALYLVGACRIAPRS